MRTFSSSSSFLPSSFTFFSLVCVVLFLFCFGLGNALRFELQLDVEKCLREDLGHDVVVLGEYSMAPSPNTQTSIRVLDPAGNEVWKTNNAQEGTFAITTDRAGIVSVCFKDTAKPGWS
jgi:hypothetical protein